MFEIRHDDDNVVVIANACLHCNDTGLTTAHCTYTKQLKQVCYHTTIKDVKLMNFTSFIVGSPYRIDTEFLTTGSSQRPHWQKYMDFCL